MIGMQPSLPEPDPHAELKFFLGQVERFRQLLLEMAEIKKQSAELDRRRTEQESTMRRAQDLHDSKIWADQQAFELECARRERGIADMEAQTKRLNEQAKEDASRAAKNEADSNARVAKIHALLTEGS